MALQWLSHASHLMLLNMADAIFPNISGHFYVDFL